MSDGIHVSQRAGRWSVTRGNYTLDEFKNQQQAIQFGKQRAKASKSSLFIHTDDGSIRLIENFQTLESRKQRGTARSA